jgi:hypothetical protein
MKNLPVAGETTNDDQWLFCAVQAHRSYSLNVVFCAGEDDTKKQRLEKEKIKCSRNQTDEQKSVPFFVPS